MGMTGLSDSLTSPSLNLILNPQQISHLPQVTDFKVGDEVMGMTGLSDSLTSPSLNLILNPQQISHLPQVTDFKVGDEVMGMTGLSDSLTSPALQPKGGYATYTTLKAANAAKKPSNISFAEASAIPLAALTAWEALESANVSSGQKVLVWGGAGGVGTFIIQMAKARGAAEVAVTCSASSGDFCKGLGADIVVDYKSENFEDVISGYDVVVDAVGYDSKCERAKKVLKAGGKLVDLVTIPSIGYLSDYKGDSVVDYAKQLIKFGGDVGYKVVGVAQNGAYLRKIASLVEEGKVKVVIDSTFSGLGEVEDAWARNKTGGAHGKIVIEL